PITSPAEQPTMNTIGRTRIDPRNLRAPPALSGEIGPVMMEGWVTMVEPGRNGARLRIMPHAITGIDPAQLPSQLRVTHRLSLNMEPGRFVRCLVVLRPPPGPSVPGEADFARSAWFEGLGAVGYVRGRCRGGTIGAPHSLGMQWRLKIGEWRRQVGLFVREAAGERAGGFAAALVSGDRSHLSIEDQEALRRSGLAHLLAISGLHMAIVGGLIYFMVFRGLALIGPLAIRVPLQKVAAFTAICASLIYLILSGASVSTQRAFIMALIVFSGIIIDRSAINLRGYALAMILVVLIAPQSVVSPGFQMSFSATGVLIVIYEAWNRRRFEAPHSRQRTVSGRVIFAIQSLIITSVAASLATLPFAIFHFGRLAPFGILANLVAMPIVSFITAPLAGLCLILAPFGASGLTLPWFGLSLEWILSVAHMGVERAPEYQTSGPVFLPGIAFCLFIGAIAAGILFKGRPRVASAACLGLAGCFTWSMIKPPIGYWGPSGELILTTGPQKLSLVEGSGLSSLRYADFLENRSCEDSCLLMSQGAVIQTVRDRLERPCMDPDKIDIVLWVPDNGSAAQSSATACQQCSPVIDWRTIQESGGVAFHRSILGDLKITQTRICADRPWQTCPRT
ncbi:MAG: ComEC/Rec2 family competence protein, partial [Pseudomonadota bacterium]